MKFKEYKLRDRYIILMLVIKLHIHKKVVMHNNNHDTICYF